MELCIVAGDETAEEVRAWIKNEVLRDVDYVKFMTYVGSKECF